MGAHKDITGQRFGKLVALKPTEKRTSGGRIWVFQCDCGNIHEAPIGAVTRGNTRSCGCLHAESVRLSNSVDLSGQRFGMLMVIGDSGRIKNGAILWECECDCGNKVLFTANQLNSGAKLNCGCDKDYRFYCVYKHVFPDGKVYIGNTSRMPLNRWHFGYKGQFNMRNAIAEIGEEWIDRISHYYLSHNGDWLLWDRSLRFADTNIFSKSEADKLEKKWIAEYDSTEFKYGLNSSNGGHSDFTYNEETCKRNSQAQPKLFGKDNHFYGKHHSETTRKKMSEKKKQYLSETGRVNFKGKHHTPETKAILSEKAKERLAREGNPFEGKHHTKETKAILSEKQKKHVTQYDIDGNKLITYSSISEAAATMGVSVSALSACVQGKSKTCAGYVWKCDSIS